MAKKQVTYREVVEWCAENGARLVIDAPVVAPTAPLERGPSPIDDTGRIAESKAGGAIVALLEKKSSATIRAIMKRAGCGKSAALKAAQQFAKAGLVHYERGAKGRPGVIVKAAKS